MEAGMAWRPMHPALLALSPLVAAATEGTRVDVLDMNLEQLRYIPVVTASRQAEPLDRAPGTILVVTRQQIRERGYVSLMDVLRDLPGVDVQSYHYSILNDAVTWRGVYGNQKFIILQDGLRISSTTSEPLAIAENFPLYQARQVEVVYGPASALYGADAFTAVVNIITQSEMNGAQVSATAGPFAYKYASAFLGTDLTHGWHLAAGMHLHRSDEPNLAKQYPELFQLHDLLDFSGKVIVPASQRAGFSSPRRSESAYLNLSSDTGFSAGFNHSRLSSNTTRADNPDFLDYTTNPQWIVSVNSSHVRYHFSFSERANSDITLSYATTEIDPDSGFDNLFGNFTLVHKYAKSSALGLTQQFDWQFPDRHSLVAGYTFERFRSIPLTADLSKKYDPSKPSDQQGIYYPGSNDTLPVRIFHDDYNNAGAFVQVKSAWTEHWSTTAGLRHDHSTAYGSSTTPRLGVVYTPTTHDTVKFTYGEAFLTPSPFLTYRHFGGFSGEQDAQGRYTSGFFFLPNPALRPETMKMFEARYGKQVSPEWRVETSVYHEKVKDFIAQTFTSPPISDFIPGGVISGTQIYENVGALTATGADIAVSYEGKLFGGNARYWSNYSFVHGTLTLLGQDSGLPLTARNKLKFGMTWQRGQYVVSPSAYLIGKTSGALGGDTGAASGYLLMNLYGAVRDVFKDVDLFIRIHNLTNRQYFNATHDGPPYDFGQSPQPRRWVMLGASMRFSQ